MDTADNKAFQVEHKGFIATGFWGSGPDGRVTVTKDGTKIFEFACPAYKIFNIAAHWPDIIDSELSGSGEGWLRAGWSGFDAYVLPKQISESFCADELVAYQQELDRQGLIRRLKSFGLFLVGALLAWLIMLEIIFTR